MHELLAADTFTYPFSMGTTFSNRFIFAADTKNKLIAIVPSRYTSFRCCWIYFISVGLENCVVIGKKSFMWKKCSKCAVSTTQSIFWNVSFHFFPRSSVLSRTMKFNNINVRGRSMGRNSLSLKLIFLRIKMLICGYCAILFIVVYCYHTFDQLHFESAYTKLGYTVSIIAVLNDISAFAA